MTDFIDTSGDDLIKGTAGDDSFDVTRGGDDTVLAGGGDDIIEMAASLTRADHVDGGDGFDQVRIAGAGYARPLVFSALTMTHVEELDVGDGQANVFDLILNDATVASGQSLQLTLEGSGLIDGSAERDGRFDMLQVTGTWTLRGGAGDDAFTDMAVWSKRDHWDGGAGTDTATFRYTGANLKFSALGLTNFEVVNLPELTTTRMNDGNVAAGHVLVVYAGEAGAFDGHAEKDGAFQVHGGFEGETLIGGQGADTVDGDQGDDVITGGGGADRLIGGWGQDTFRFASIQDSAAGAVDHIADLEDGDRIDLSRIDADTHAAGDQAFHLVAKFTHHAGEATLAYSAATDATLLSLDVTGDGVADAVIALDGDHRAFAGFIL